MPNEMHPNTMITSPCTHPLCGIEVSSKDNKNSQTHTIITRDYQPVTAYPASYVGYYFAYRQVKNRFDILYKYINEPDVLFHYLKHTPYMDTVYWVKIDILSEAQIIYLIDFHNSISFVNWIPKSKITYDMAKRYPGKFNGHMLDSIDRRLIDQALVDAYFSASPGAVLYIPPKFITERMLDVATEFDPSIYLLLKPPFRLRKYALRYLKSPGANLFHTLEHIDQELIEAALSTDSMNYHYIPIEFRTAAVKEYYLSLNRAHTLESIRSCEQCDPKITRRYLKNHLSEIYAFPPSHLNQTLVDLLLEDNPTSIEYIPEQFLDSKLVESIVHQTPIAAIYVPESLLTEELMYYAVTQNSNWVSYFPEHKLTRRVCEQAFYTGCVKMKEIPAQYQTVEMLKIALSEGDREDVQYLSLDLMTDDLYRSGALSGRLSFSQIPEHLQTVDLLYQCSKQRFFHFTEDLPLHLVHQIPSLLVKCLKRNWPNSARFQELMQMWTQEQQYSQDDIRQVLACSPARLQSTVIWKHWALMYL